MSPEDILSKKSGGFKSYLGLTRDKSEYMFKFNIKSSQLKNLKGGRDHVRYIPGDFRIDRDMVEFFGKTPRKGR